MELPPVLKTSYCSSVFWNRIFHEINHPTIWVPPFMEIPIIIYIYYIYILYILYLYYIYIYILYWYHNYRNQKGLGDMLTLGWSPWDSLGLPGISASPRRLAIRRKELAQCSASQIAMIYGIPSWYMVYGYGYMGIPWHTELMQTFFGEKQLH